MGVLQTVRHLVVASITPLLLFSHTPSASLTTGGPGSNPEPAGATAVGRQVFSGQTGLSFFGGSVSSAGDMNGDGYQDIAVGAEGFNANTGRVYIYFGGPTMDAVPDVVLNGQNPNDRFGGKVVSAGDWNGDGFDDLLVGASGYSSNTGRVYLYFGGAAVNTLTDGVFTGETAGSMFGGSIAGGNDVNGDGAPDLVVGAPGYSASKGRCYVFYGGASFNTIVDATFNGSVAAGYFGSAVATAADMNGDGYGDVIVGAYGTGSYTGRVQIYFGGAAMDTTADLTLTGFTSSYFGYAIACAGDLNGDGFSDLAVGAYYWNGARGAACVYFGGAAMGKTIDITVTGAVVNTEMGYSVSTAGDVNGDGYSDLLIGADGHNGYTGRAFVCYGGPAMDNAPDIILSGDATNDLFGNAVACAGDVNGDGYSDLLVGAYYAASATGKAYLYQNSLTGTDIPDETFSLIYGSIGGDINGDGYHDLVGLSNDSKRIAVCFGGTAIDTTTDILLPAPAGYPVLCSTFGDLNGDGCDDIVVTDYDSSKHYIYFGGSSISVIPNLTLLPDFRARSVTYIGDVNGDGCSDLALWDVGNKFTKIYYGGASMDSFADVTLFANDMAISSISSAKDVNGDHFDDVIIGAAGYDSGWAYIYWGEKNGIQSEIGLILRGETTDSKFGNSVCGVGDMNGDGSNDVVVGSPGANEHNGKVYVYFGGTKMDVNPDIILIGGINALLGYAVAPAGDVNGDGFQDVLTFKGNDRQGHLYLGGMSTERVPVIDFAMPDISYKMSAGDVNGDGQDDILSSSTLNYNKTQLFLSSSPPAAPRIAAAKDVPYDQGGKIVLQWIRSAFDVQGMNTISSYSIERSIPPGTTGYAWEEVASIPPRQNSRYAVTLTTPNDSIAAFPASMFYRVTARTAGSGKVWRSNIVPAHSVDNLSPSAIVPEGITPVSGNGALLWWKKNTTDPDLKGYVVYRTTVAGSAAHDSTVLARTTDSMYMDLTRTAGTAYYYRIAGEDIHGNIGAASPELSTGTLSVSGGSLTPTEFSLQQNYPNPFNPSTTIRYTVGSVPGRAASPVRITLHDLLGRECGILVDAVQSAGEHEVRFDAAHYSGGVYFYTLTSGDVRQVRRMVLLK